MSVNSKMTALANEIRTLNGTSGTLSLDTMKSEVGEANTVVQTQSDLIVQIANVLSTKAGVTDGLNSDAVTLINQTLQIKHNGSTQDYKEVIDNAILTLPFGNIPSYHHAEAGRVVKRLLELKAQYPNSIILGTISDNHVDKTNSSTMTSARHAVYALESVGSMACDFIANLGDNVVGTNIDNDTDYANAVYMENASRYVMSSLESFNLVGNHCKSNSTQRIYDLIGKYNSFDNYGTNQIRGFGYKDYDDKKVRVIVLNTCDYWNGQGGNGMSYEQKDFFMKALDLSSKTNYADWTTIVLSHIPLDFLGGDYNKGADLKAILKAYNNGTSVSITVNSSYASAQNESSKYSGTLTYNYSGKNAVKVINIHGHIHTNAYGYLTFIDDNTQLNMIRLATPNSSFNGNASTDRYTSNGNYSITTEEANKIKKVANSKADTSATFYFIDLANQVVYAIGYGADIDRILSYKDEVRYTITYSLSNITSSNTTALVTEDSEFNTYLTAKAGYSIDKVTVTMGGVDISSRYSAELGYLTIPAVTGNIVITATAVEEVSYNNLFVASDVQLNTRWNSSGETTSGSFWCMTTYIPVAQGNVVLIRLANAKWSTHTQRVIATYNSSKTHVDKDIYVTAATVSSDGYTLTATIPAGVGYIRISGAPNNNASGTIITINEEIK